MYNEYLMVYNQHFVVLKVTSFSPDTFLPQTVMLVNFSWKILS